MNEEELLQFMREALYKPLNISELEEELKITDAVEFKELVKLLNKLEDEGKVVRTRTNRYGIPERMNLIRGRLQANPKGFGFVIPDQEGIDDIYVLAKDLHGAMNGDIVLARIAAKGRDGGKREGEIVRIIERANQTVVGTYQDSKNFGFVIPDEKRLFQDIFIPKEKNKGAVDGHKVVVRITKYPEERLSPEGEIIEILGHKNDPGVDILAIIRKYDLPEKFPDEVLKEAEEIKEEIPPEEYAKRKDLRNLKIVTIDGEDAKDLDDAVNVTKLPNGNYLLGVHIADVSYYVKEGSPLDKEAVKRGTSVYLVDRVIPMLPHRLSNGICSLNPQVDRLTLSCQMEIDREGNVVDHEIFPSIIKTTERMTYTNIYKILEEDDQDLKIRYQDLLNDFYLMKELALILREKRMRRGAIDFDFAEAKVVVDSAGKPIDILKRKRTIAEQIIEEFMLAANETVAEHFYWLNLPFVFRVHEEPKAEKIFNFIEFISNFGYVVRGNVNKIHPRALQQILEEIKESPEENVISTVMLRSMKQAKYSHESLGHFGLAAEYYTHFTSPIRRYPDLMIHRIMREYLTNNGLTKTKEEHFKKITPEIAEHSSLRERIADEAERETEELKKAEYMQQFIGQEFDGIISSVTSFGMFVALDNTVEGMVHVSYLYDDYYYFHEKQYALIGEHTGKVYRIGDEVRVRVLSVNIDEHNIDFELVASKNKGQTKQKRAKVIVGKISDEKGKNKKLEKSKDEIKKVKSKVKEKGKKKVKKEKRRKG